MFLSRLLLCLGLIAVSPSLFSQGSFTSIKIGRWDNATVWNLTAGSDADGIPDADDNVLIENFIVNVHGNHACNNLTIKGTTSSTTLHLGYNNNAYNELTVNGNLILDGRTQQSILNIYNGTFEVLGDIEMYYSKILFYHLSGTTAKELILNGSYSKYTSYPSGQILSHSASPVLITSTFSGSSTQTIPLFYNGSIQHQHNNIKIDGGQTVTPGGNITNSSVIGFIQVLNNSTLDLNEYSVSVDKIVDQVTIESGSAIRYTNVNFSAYLDQTTTGFPISIDPDAYTVINCDNGDYTFNNTTGVGPFELGNVVKTGSEKITINSNITAAINSFGINSLEVREGVIEIGSSVTDISGISGDITIKSGATLRILGNPTMPLASQFILEQGSTVEYAGNVVQTVLGGLDYWNLAFDGTGVKTTSAALSFQGEMSFGTDATTLNINHDITIQSDMLNTGFISEVPTGYIFTYGGGQFICERYFITSPIDNNNASENYRDFSLPLKNAQALLSQFDDDNPAAYIHNGIKFTNLVELPILGPTGSKYPGSGTNVSDFNSFTGAFGKPSNYNNSIVQTNGTGRITTNAVRFGFGDDDGLTIMAKGEVNLGDIPFNAQKSIFGKEYNLFGNPYPCAIDFEAVVADNPNFNTSGSGIIPTFYIIAPDLVGANNTGFYNAVTNAGTVPSTIPAFQGFFLEASGADGSNYDFTIKENMKSGINLATYKSNEIENAPELFSIIVRENNAVKDQIHSYFFEGATANYDKFFDVQKLEPKVKQLTGALVDFYDGKKKMNLLANAIDADAPMNLQFVVENPNSNAIELELENLSHLLDVYNCVYVENVRTGETFSIVGNYLSIPLGNIASETFVIKGNSAPDLFEISTADATCFGSTDGLLHVDMSNLPDTSTVTLYKNNTVYDSFSAASGVYKRNVGAGNYEFKISGASETCTYIYRESVTEEPEVKSEFTIADSLFSGRDLVFKSSAENATTNEWFTSFGETFYGDSIVLNYETAGKYWLKLTAIGKYSHCKDEELKFFYVDSAQTAVGVEEFDNTSVYAEVVISTQPEQLTISKLPSNTKVELINNVGQILQISDENKGIVTFAPLNNASYIIRLTNKDEVKNYHIGL